LEPQHTNLIFDPFFTTKKDGIGMGLTISRSIVEAHGGRLWAERKMPNGTILNFTLPLTARVE
jgi:signal transduction histidine kinase